MNLTPGWLIGILTGILVGTLIGVFALAGVWVAVDWR